MNKLLMLVGIFGFAVASNADIAVTWDNQNYVKDHNGTWDAYTGTAQLIWSSEDPSSHMGNFTTVDSLDASGTEFLLETYATQYNYLSADGEAGEFGDAFVNNFDITSGFLLMRFYDTSTIGEGSYYYESVVTSPVLSTYNDMDTDTIIALTGSGAYVGNAGVVANIAAIPEPATLLIFGPGIAGLLAYRRRKQKLSDQVRNIFERRQEVVQARKAIAGAERGQADYMASLGHFADRFKKVDVLGNTLMAIDKVFSK